MNKTLLLVIAIIVVIAIGAFALTRPSTTEITGPGDDNTNGKVCTADAMQCPDGSYVGRTPPSCQFAACPATTTIKSGINLETSMNRPISGLGVTITPLSVVEDSRCPVDVNCIQAGTVRVSATLESAMGKAPQTFTLGVPVTTEAETVELVGVKPGKVSTKQISSGDYQFTFQITKRTP